MAPADRPESAPTPHQVREYILSMLDGLSALADAAGDGDTGKRVRQCAHGLIVAWSTSPGRPSREGWKAADSEAPSEARGGPADAS